MRQSVLGFNQAQAVHENLDLTDLMLLQYILMANGTPDMKHIIKDDVSYVWLSHSKIHEDLPILNITEGTLRNKLMSLKKNGWIISETVRTSVGATTYYSISLKAMSLVNDKGTENGSNSEEPCHSEMTCPCHSRMTSDNKLIDNKLIDNSTNVELEQPAVTPKTATKRKPLLGTVSNNMNSASDKVNSVSKQDTSNNGVVSPIKKKNLYEKCADLIDEYAKEDIKLKNKLIEFLLMRLDLIRLKNKPFSDRTFKSYLNRLSELANNTSDKLKIIQYSIDGQYPAFYPLKNNYKGQNRDVFSEYGKVKSEHIQEEVVNVPF